jgi:hypothetical protein
MYWSILLIFFSKSKWAWAYHRRASCSSQLAKIGAERGKIGGKGAKVEMDTEWFLDSRRWAWFLLPPRLSQHHHTCEKPPRPLVPTAPSPCSHRTALSSSRMLVWEGVGLCGVRIEANYFSVDSVRVVTSERFHQFGFLRIADILGHVQW